MNYIVFDLEASCGWPKENRQSEIIEIGAVKYNNKLEKVDEFQAFVRPVLNPELTEFCTNLTKITQADVDNADTFQHVFHDFHNWCIGDRYSKDKNWLCSWGFYDRNQLKQDCALWNIENTSWLNSHISIKHQHGQMLAQEHAALGKEKTRQLSKGVGMMTALQMLKLSADGTHHRGIDDARNIGKIFVKLFPQLKFPE